VVLNNNIFEIGDAEKKQAQQFLQKEYEREALSFPYVAPPFDASAALYAAITTYQLAQLLLYRQQRPEEVLMLLQPYPEKITAGAMLSADLTFRFLPDFFYQFKAIDFEDPVLPFVLTLCEHWHYAAIRMEQDVSNLDFSMVQADACLMQLYIDRIIESKNIALAHLPFFKERIEGILSIHKETLWNNF
jgi:hypothetical protein